MADGDTERSPWVEPGEQPPGNGSGSGSGSGSGAALEPPSGPPAPPAPPDPSGGSPWMPAAPPWAAVGSGPPPRSQGQGLIIAGIVVLSVVVVAALVGVIVVLADGDERDPDRGDAAADDGWVRDGELHLVQLAVDGETVCSTGERDLFCLDGTTGDELWSEQIPGLTTSPTLVGETLVVGAEGAEGGDQHGDLYGYSLDGRRQWGPTRLRSVDTGGVTPGIRPALPAAGHIVAVPAGEVPETELVGVDARTGREAWRAFRPEPAGTPGGPIGTAVSDGDRFYAVVVAPLSGRVTADDLRNLDPADPTDAVILRILDEVARADPADPLDPSDPEDLQLMLDTGILELVNAELATAEPVTTLVALDGATGTERWRAELDGAAYEVDAAVPLADGSAVALVINAESDRVVVFDVETGEQRWEAPLTSDRAAVAHVDGVTVVAEGTTVAGFDGDGTELWRVGRPGADAGDIPDTPPGLTVEDGTLYAFGADVHEIDPRDGASRVVGESVAAIDVAVAGDHLVVAGVGLEGIRLRD
jgi:outer membrane protein assembly factor BamB